MENNCEPECCVVILWRYYSDCYRQTCFPVKMAVYDRLCWIPLRHGTFVLVLDSLKFLRGQHHSAVCLIVLGRSNHRWDQHSSRVCEAHPTFITQTAMQRPVGNAEKGHRPADILRFDGAQGKLTWCALYELISRGNSSNVFTLGWHGLDGPMNTHPPKGTQL